MSWRELPIVARAGHQVDRARAWWRRARALPLLLRVVVWLTGSGGLLLAAPPQLPALGVVLVGALVALAAAAGPGGSWPGRLIALAVGLLALRMVTGDEVPLPVVAALAATLYLHHTGAALAAALRTDTAVPPAVVWHWARRVAVVLLVAAVVGAGIAGVAAQAPAGPPTLLVTVSAASAVAVVGVLAYLRHRRVGAD